MLPDPCPCHLLPHACAGLSLFPTLELADLKLGRKNPNVQSVQNRTRNPGKILPDLKGCAAASVPIRIIAAGTGIRSPHQHEIRRIGEAAAGSGNLNSPVLHGLTQKIQCLLFELRHLVQKKNTSVRKTDHTGSGNSSAPGQSLGRDGMVGIEKGPPADIGGILIQQPGNAVDGRNLKNLLPCKKGKDGGQPPCGHGLSRARRSHNQQIVKAGRRNKGRPLYTLLPHNLTKIRFSGNRLIPALTQAFALSLCILPHPERLLFHKRRDHHILSLRRRVQVFNGCGKTGNSHDLYPLNPAGLPHIALRYQTSFNPRLMGLLYNRKDSLYRTHFPVKPKLSEQKNPLQRTPSDLLHGAEQPGRYREVKGRPLLLDICR